MSDMGPLEVAARRSRERAGIASPTVDSNARRQAILFEISAVADRYTADLPGKSQAIDRYVGVMASADHLSYQAHRGRDLEPAVRELAGRCVAWLEHLEAEKAKA